MDLDFDEVDFEDWLAVDFTSSSPSVPSESLTEEDASWPSTRRSASVKALTSDLTSPSSFVPASVVPVIYESFELVETVERLSESTTRCSKSERLPSELKSDIERRPLLRLPTEELLP